jgi:ubiquinone/menaquinone biosynthesis C-methylase UbiE
MTMASSYVPDELPGGLEREIERLDVQVDLSWRKERSALERAGIADSRSLLEVGCGPGHVTRRLLDAAPHAVITAIDISSELLSRVPPSPRLRLHARSIYDLQSRNEFDFCVARFVLQHLESPPAALERILDVLVPGGTVALIEADAQMLALSEPYSPALSRIYGRAEALQMSRGGNRMLGRRLYRLLTEAGFIDVRHDAVIYHSDEIGLEPFAAQMTPDRLVPALRAGLITHEEMESVRAHHRAFFASAGSFVMMVGFIATGRKPPG